MNANTKRHALLAKIHVAKKQVGMNEEMYRTFLHGRFGVESCRELDDRGLDQVLREFRTLGFQDTPARQERPPLADDPQSRMIRYLWLELNRLGAVHNKSETALLAFVKRMTREETLQDCTDWQKSRVIEELKSWESRTRSNAHGLPA